MSSIRGATRTEAAEEEVEEDEGVRVPGYLCEDNVDEGPDGDEEGEEEDEAPGAADGRHVVRGLPPEGLLRLELPVEGGLHHLSMDDGGGDACHVVCDIVVCWFVRFGRSILC